MAADLFGDDPPPLKDPNGKVRLHLTAFDHRKTAKALFLSKTGREAHGKYVPISEVAHGVGPDINLWTLPRWLAAEKGWL